MTQFVSHHLPCVRACYTSYDDPENKQRLICTPSFLYCNSMVHTSIEYIYYIKSLKLTPLNILCKYLQRGIISYNMIKNITSEENLNSWCKKNPKWRDIFLNGPNAPECIFAGNFNAHLCISN